MPAVHICAVMLFSKINDINFLYNLILSLSWYNDSNKFRLNTTDISAVTKSLHYAFVDASRPCCLTLIDGIYAFDVWSGFSWSVAPVACTYLPDMYACPFEGHDKIYPGRTHVNSRRRSRTPLHMFYNMNNMRAGWT